ncbi:hypothetical protein KXX32_000584 [Aspergillus fumigatus]|nr:hypothetical protein KXX32_000584 [Aspergillus fumigatus]
MPKRSKLLQALDAHKGRDYDAEKQRKLVKAAEKRKATKKTNSGDGENKEEGTVETNGKAQSENLKSKKRNDSEDEVGSSDNADGESDKEATVEAEDSEEDEIDEEEEGEEEEEEHFPIEVPDPNDDLNRELAFYKVCQAAASEARRLLKKEGVPFTRPGDYFAEMVKTDEHMSKIKKKLYDEAAAKKAAAEARKQRDLKKFGKQVQVAKLQQRQKEKRETLEKINELKKKRKADKSGITDKDNDLFDIAIEDSGKSNSRKRSRGNESGGPSLKRQKKNEKYGFGGKKRHAKSGDAISSGDLRNFSVKKMKGGSKRPGKSKRAAAKGRS